MEWLGPLRQDGIMIGPSADLFQPNQLEAAQAEATRVRGDRFARLQAGLESRDRRQAKGFLRQWLGRHPLYDGQSVWADVARRLTPLATAYLEAPALLRFYNLWEVLPTTQPPCRSQLWHRDMEDTRIVKAFLYLSDVVPGAGPFIYAPGTQRGGAVADRVPDTFIERSSGWIRASDAAMATIVPPVEWRGAYGPKGTLVVADTAGWHKGGYATSTSRLTATWEWTTAQAIEGSRFHALGGQP